MADFNGGAKIIEIAFFEKLKQIVIARLCEAISFLDSYFERGILRS